MVLDVPSFLPKLFSLVNHKKKAVRREACWTLSNITAGQAPQIGRIMEHEIYMQNLIKIATEDVEEVTLE